MPTFDEFVQISPCEYADALPRSQFMDYHIRPLWQGMPRIAGPAFTVECGEADHLMLHVAIYEAKPGDILVVKGDSNFALSGGNVCAIAQQRGIKGMVVDGLIRDLAEVRDIQFPVFARGVIPKPGAKKISLPLNQPTMVGGVLVNPDDVVIADEEGIAVVPKAEQESAYDIAAKRTASDAAMTLEQWRDKHHKKVYETLEQLNKC